MRGREGEKLQAIIQQRLDGITVEAEKVRSQMPTVLQWQRERLLQRFEEAKIQLDPQRVAPIKSFLVRHVVDLVESSLLQNAVINAHAAIVKPPAFVTALFQLLP